MVVSTLGDTLYCGHQVGTVLAHLTVTIRVSTKKVDTNIITGTILEDKTMDTFTLVIYYAKTGKYKTAHTFCGFVPDITNDWIFADYCGPDYTWLIKPGMTFEHKATL